MNCQITCSLCLSLIRRSTAHALSRTTSKETVTQSRHFLQRGSRQQLTSSFRSSRAPQKPGHVQTMTGEKIPTEENDAKSPQPQSSDGSSSESSSESEGVGGQSQAFRRMPKFSNRIGTLTGDAAGDGDDEEDDEPAFLPFSNATAPTNQDPSATLRNPSDVGEQVSNRQQNPSSLGTQSQAHQHHQRTESSASSGSSAAAVGTHHQRPPGPLSPRHRAELAKLSPRLQKGSSDGTPSMGSSFSDLDGALNSSTTSLRSGYDRILSNR